MAGLYLGSVSIFGYSEELNPYNVPPVLILLLACSLVARMVVLRQRPIMPASIALFLLWLGFSAMTMLAIAKNPLSSESYMTTVKVAVSAAVFVNVPQQLGDIRRLLIGFVLAFPVVVFMNFNELQGAVSSMQYGTLRDTERFAGTLANANTAAWYAMAAGWASLMLMLLTRGKLRILWATIVAASIGMILMSGSRKGLLAIPISAVVLYAVYYMKNTKRRASAIILFPVMLLVAYVLFGAILSSPFGGRLEVILSGESEYSADARMHMAQAGIQIFLDNPVFGIGYDQYRFHSWKYGAAMGMYSHSTFIEIMSCTGLVGLTIFVAALFFAFKQINTARRHSKNASQTLLMSLSVGFLVLYLWYSLTAVAFDDKFAWPLLGALLGYAARIIHAGKQTPKVPRLVRKTQMSLTKERSSVLQHHTTVKGFITKSRSHL
jgi:O-antigen ligase